MPVAQTEIVIQAPIARVWSVITDIHRYPEWNPFVVKIDCTESQPRVGTGFTLNVQFKDAKSVVKTWEQITRMEPPAARDGAEHALLEYEFLGPLHSLYLVRGRRQQWLESLPDGSTRYRTYERLHGLLAWAAPIAKVQDGFERHAAALKQRAESLR